MHGHIEHRRQIDLAADAGERGGAPGIEMRRDAEQGGRRVPGDIGQLQLAARADAGGTDRQASIDSVRRDAGDAAERGHDGVKRGGGGVEMGGKIEGHWRAAVNGDRQ